MLLNTDLAASDIPLTDYVTLRHEGFRNFGDENYRILSKIPGAKWSALRLERDRLSANFQGNPLWPHKALARYPKLSHALGLSGAFDDDRCLLPTWTTANRFLRDLNLHDFRYSADPIADDRTYVDAFINGKTLPMAPETERNSVHDWAYHFVTFLFPEYLENVRLNLEWIRANLHRFEGHVTRPWIYYGHQHTADGQMKIETRPELLCWKETIYRQMAISLDVCTAKIVQILCMDERGLLPRCMSELDIVAKFSKGITAQSLGMILWLEPNLDLALPNQSNAVFYTENTMEYLRSTLARLELSGALINDKRSEFFKEKLKVR